METLIPKAEEALFLTVIAKQTLKAHIEKQQTEISNMIETVFGAADKPKMLKKTSSTVTQVPATQRVGRSTLGLESLVQVFELVKDDKMWQIVSSIGSIEKRFEIFQETIFAI